MSQGDSGGPVIVADGSTVWAVWIMNQWVSRLPQNQCPNPNWICASALQFADAYTEEYVNHDINMTRSSHGTELALGLSATHFASTVRKAHRPLFSSGAANCTETAAIGAAPLHVSWLGILSCVITPTVTLSVVSSVRTPVSEEHPCANTAR